jgi:hypothetical protein
MVMRSRPEAVWMVVEGWKKVVESVLRVAKNTLEQRTIGIFEQLVDVRCVLRAVAASLTPP